MTYKKPFLFFTLLCISLFFFGCNSKLSTKEGKNTSISGTNLLFDTSITITLYGTSNQAILDHCFSICKNYEKIFSRTLDYSELSLINQSKERFISLSDDMEILLEKALYYCNLSNGTLDITMGSVISLWNFKTDKPSLPNENNLKAALNLVDYRNLSIQNHQLQRKVDTIQIDLGSIAKGYIADQIKAYLLSEDITSALINLGGNVLCVGEKLDSEPFQIGIQKPFAIQNETIAILSIKDKSVVSSGTYERYFEKDNVLYHHILNPKTGYPYNNNLLSVTIVSDNSVDGDALSTICFTFGLEKGLELINSIENTYAIFVTDDYKLHYSDGFLDSISVEETN